MRILIFGAGGGVGRYLLQQALAAGDEVCAVVRDAAKLALPHPHLRVITADVFDAAATDAAIAQCLPLDAVASCLNTHQGIQPSDELARMANHVTTAMRHHGIGRIVYCASAGVEDELTGERGQAAMQFLRHPLADHKAAIAHIRAAGLSATIIRPMGLMDGGASGHYWEADAGVPTQGTGRVLRGDVAALMLKALHDNAYIGRSVAVSN